MEQTQRILIQTKILDAKELEIDVKQIEDLIVSEGLEKISLQKR